MGRKNTFTVLLFLVSLPLQAGFQIYSAPPEEVKWRSSGNRYECRISQSIPGYGKAMFNHTAMRPVEFRVATDQVPRTASQALVYVKPPEWKRYANREVLGRVPVNPVDTVIVLPEDWAYRLAYELQEGMVAAWSHPDWADGTDLVSVNVLPIHFKKAWQAFRTCQSNLIRYTYKDVRHKQFFYKKGNTGLTSSIKKYLDKVAEYAMLDPEFDYIQIHSSTDSRGIRQKNLTVSKKRAEAIKKYLLNKGIDAKQIRVIAQGEKNPKYNNRTSSGRAKNRRVEVTMIK